MEAFHNVCLPFHELLPLNVPIHLKNTLAVNLQISVGPCSNQSPLNSNKGNHFVPTDQMNKLV